MSRPLAPIELAARDVAQAADTIRALLGDDDERALIDMLEGETDLFTIVRSVMDSIEQDEGDAAALATQIEVRKERQARCEQRIEAKRRGLVRLMEAAKLDKLPLPEVTLSMRDVASKLVIVDPAAVPDEYTMIVRKPSLVRINAAFADADTIPNWLNRDPARRTLSLRRK